MHRCIRHWNALRRPKGIHSNSVSLSRVVNAVLSLSWGSPQSWAEGKHLYVLQHSIFCNKHKISSFCPFSLENTMGAAHGLQLSRITPLSTIPIRIVLRMWMWCCTKSVCPKSSSCFANTFSHFDSKAQSFSYCCSERSDLLVKSLTSFGSSRHQWPTTASTKATSMTPSYSRDKLRSWGPCTLASSMWYNFSNFWYRPTDKL